MRRHASSDVIRSPQLRHTASVVVPCSSSTVSAGSPDRWCSRSMFWVIRASSRPCRCSSTNAWCPALGFASRMAGHASAFWRQYSTRPASLDTNSWKSTVRFRAHTPFGLRKSGTPDSVEMPAPVKPTMLDAPAISSRAACSSMV